MIAKSSSMLALLLCVLTLTTLTSCDDAEMRRAATAADRMAGAISAAIEIERELYVRGLIDDDEAKLLLRGLLETNRAVYQFNQRARTYKNFDAHARSDLLRLLGDITSGLAELSRTTMFIENVEARARLQAALDAASQAAHIIQEALK